MPGIAAASSSEVHATMRLAYTSGDYALATPDADASATPGDDGPATPGDGGLDTPVDDAPEA